MHFVDTINYLLIVIVFINNNILMELIEIDSEEFILLSKVPRLEFVLKSANSCDYIDRRSKSIYLCA